MIENFASFEYKTQEEVLTVIRYVTSALSVSGVHVVDILHDLVGDRAPSGDAMVHHLLSPNETPLLTQLISQQIEQHAPENICELLNCSMPFVRTHLSRLDVPTLEFSRTCTGVAMLLILKSHLKGMYSMSEE